MVLLRRKQLSLILHTWKYGPWLPSSAIVVSWINSLLWASFLSVAFRYKLWPYFWVWNTKNLLNQLRKSEVLNTKILLLKRNIFSLLNFFHLQHIHGTGVIYIGFIGTEKNGSDTSYIKNPAYGIHWICWPMRIVGPIQFWIFI